MTQAGIGSVRTKATAGIFTRIAAKPARSNNRDAEHHNCQLGYIQTDFTFGSESLNDTLVVFADITNFYLSNIALVTLGTVNKVPIVAAIHRENEADAFFDCVGRQPPRISQTPNTTDSSQGTATKASCVPMPTYLIHVMTQ